MRFSALRIASRFALRAAAQAAALALLALSAPAVAAPDAMDWRRAMADCLVNDAAMDHASVIAVCGAVIDAQDAPDHLRARAAAMRGAAHAELGASAFALEDFTAAIALDPADPAARAQRAGVRLALKDMRGALSDLDAAVSLDPGYAPLREIRAAARFAGGQEAAALDDWRAAHRLDPSRYPADPLARLGVARAARALDRDDVAAARAEAGAALERAPGDAVALSLLGAVAAAEGAHDRAVALLIEAMEADRTVGRGIERSLQALGHDPGAIDGLPSAMTRSALTQCFEAGCRLFRDPRFRFF